MRRLWYRMRYGVPWYWPPELDVEKRPDYTYRRGRRAQLWVGPFTFGIDTSDRGSAWFDVETGGRRFSWETR